jgi:hypothetical protein
MSEHNQNQNCAPGASGREAVEPPAGDTVQLQSPQTFFPLFPGKTPRAFAAFMAFFQLGPNRALQAVADQPDENLGPRQEMVCEVSLGRPHPILQLRPAPTAGRSCQGHALPRETAWLAANEKISKIQILVPFGTL